jgi:hypothetical protein
MYLTPNTPGILILVFLTFIYGISLYEKFYDWDRVFNFYDRTFKKTPLKNLIKPLIALMMFFESLNFLFLSIGLYQLIVYQKKETAILACTIASCTSLYILAGQRIAKNYSATNALSVYFVISIFGIFLFID